MNITISFDVDGYTEKDELVAWLNATMAGEPIKLKRTRKPRQPMTDAEKDAFRERMVKGKEEAAKAQNKEEPVSNSESTLTNTATEKAKTTSKTNTTPKAVTKKG